MKVEQLIQYLDKFPRDAKVVVETLNGYQLDIAGIGGEADKIGPIKAILEIRGDII